MTGRSSKTESFTTGWLDKTCPIKGVGGGGVGGSLKGLDVYIFFPREESSNLLPKGYEA